VLVEDQHEAVDLTALRQVEQQLVVVIRRREVRVLSVRDLQQRRERRFVLLPEREQPRVARGPVELRVEGEIGDGERRLVSPCAIANWPASRSAAARTS
jgi:hypothetical protein